VAEHKWFTINDAAPLLGFSSPRSLREWLNKGRQKGWIKVGTHVKPITPGSTKPQWKVNVENCDRIGTKK
jgi:predicted transcriptional regulator of viral defense system